MINKQQLFYSSILVLPILFFSCYSTPLINVPYEYKNFETGQPLRSTVGSVMIKIESGTKSEAQDKSKELTSIQKSFQFGSERGISQELVYIGKAGNVINITYREYSIEGGNKYIRDGFTEKFQYDISESNIISFRSLIIEIIEANSNEIKFKVL